MNQPQQWSLAHGRALPLGPLSVVMGILNVTPDSFSDGGQATSVDAAVASAQRMIEEGAAIVDIGGESTRPGADPVTAREEQRRILPVVEALAGREGVLLSVDTYREETARLAIEAGAHIVNDIKGLQGDTGIARLAAHTGCGLVVMHNSRDRFGLPDLVDDQVSYFERSLSIARRCGVPDAAIVLDPGFGFGKDLFDNLGLIARFAELSALGFPFLVGTSRKRFLGHVTGRGVESRDVVTAASSAILRLRGAAIFRVHDVASSIDSLRLADAILDRERNGNAR